LKGQDAEKIQSKPVLRVGARLNIPKRIDERRRAPNSQNVDGPLPIQKWLIAKKPQYGHVRGENEQSAVQNVMKINEATAHFRTHLAVAGSPVCDGRPVHAKQFARRTHTECGNNPVQELGTSERASGCAGASTCWFSITQAIPVSKLRETSV
jgi:hypothetical protein